MQFFLAITTSTWTGASLRNFSGFGGEFFWHKTGRNAVFLFASLRRRLLLRKTEALTGKNLVGESLVKSFRGRVFCGRIFVGRCLVTNFRGNFIVGEF